MGTNIRRKRGVRILCVVFALIVAGYLTACLYLFVFQRELIFFPARDVLRTPAEFRLPYRDIRIPMGKDSDFVHGWWLEASTRRAPTILYLHGNDLNLGGNVGALVRLHDMGFSILAIDYRGFGKSGGRFPSEATVYEDAEAAWKLLVQQEGIDPRSIFIYGHSLGSAIAIDVAAHHPDAGGLIAESGFTSMREMAGTTYWMFPIRLILDQRFDALGKVTQVRSPALFIHGMDDKEVPYTMSERLYDAKPGFKRLALIPAAGHEDVGVVGASAYATAIIDFMRNTEESR